MRTAMLLLVFVPLLLVAAAEDPQSVGYRYGPGVITDSDPGLYASGDFDGDDLVDLVEVDAVEGEVRIRRNTGDATFSTWTTLTGPDRPERVLARDLNGDGRDDVLVTHPIGIDIHVSDGAAGFVTQEYTRTWNEGEMPAFIDHDSDGDDDLVVFRFAPAEPPAFELLVNDGTGRFEAGFTIGLPYEPETLSVGDVTGDGRPDIVCYLEHEGIYYLPNEGGTGFGDAAEVHPLSVEDVAAVDVNGDGVADIVAIRDGPGSLDSAVYVYQSRGGGEFASFKTYDAACEGRPTQHPPTTLWTADIDGDGDEDLLTNTVDTYLTAILNRGDGTFGMHQEYRTAYGEDVRQVLAADWIGDGGTDLLVLCGDHFSAVLEPGGPTPPAVSSIEPAHVRSGDEHTLVINGSGFTETTDVVIDGVSVSDWQLLGPDRIQITSHPDAIAVNDPYDDNFRRHDVRVVDRATGGAVVLREAFRVRGYWDLGLILRKGALLDRNRNRRDSVKLRGNIDHQWNPPSLEAQYGKDVEIRIGRNGSLGRVTIRGDDPGWSRSPNGRRITYLKKTGTPRIRLEFRDNRARSFKMSIRRIEFSSPLDGDVWVEMDWGDLRIAGHETWEMKGDRVK